jgi:hypothetical protein
VDKVQFEYATVIYWMYENGDQPSIGLRPSSRD